MSANYLLISDEILKERTSIHGSIDPKLIYPDIKVSQDMYILPVLGTALYEVLQAHVLSGDWTGKTDYKALLDNYIIDALMYYTLAELPTTLGYQLWNKGVVRKIGTDTELPSMSDLIDISNKYRERGQYYANRLRLYLVENGSTKFPEYLAPGSGADTIHPDNKAFTMPVYLGDDDTDCRYNGVFPYKPYS